MAIVVFLRRLSALLAMSLVLAEPANAEVSDEALQALINREVTIEQEAASVVGVVIGVGATSVTILTSSGDVISVGKVGIVRVRMAPAMSPLAQEAVAPPPAPVASPPLPVASPPVPVAPPAPTRAVVDDEEYDEWTDRATIKAHKAVPPTNNNDTRRADLERRAAEIHGDWDYWSNTWWGLAWAGLGGCIPGAIAGAAYLAWGGQTLFDYAAWFGGCGTLMVVPGYIGGMVSNVQLDEAARLEAEARKLASLVPLGESAHISTVAVAADNPADASGMASENENENKRRGARVMAY